MSNALAILVAGWPSWTGLAIALVPLVLLAACAAGIGAMIALGLDGR